MHKIHVGTTCTCTDCQYSVAAMNFCRVHLFLVTELVAHDYIDQRFVVHEKQGFGLQW